MGDLLLERPTVQDFQPSMQSVVLHMEMDSTQSNDLIDNVWIHYFMLLLARLVYISSASSMTRQHKGNAWHDHSSSSSTYE